MTMLDTLAGVSEFTWIDPEELHLVKRPANNFDSPLLAKAAEALEEEYEAFVKKFVDGICNVKECEVCHERLTLVKSVDGLLEKAKLKVKARNALSDGDFAYIDSKGERHLPIHDKSHVRNALARFNQTHFESEDAKAAAHRKIVARAKEMGIDVDEGAEKAEMMECDACHGKKTIHDGAQDCPKCKGSGTMAKELAPDKSVPKEEALSQTHEVSRDVSTGIDPAAGDGGEPKHPADMSTGHADGDGEGDTSQNKEVPKDQALAQTHDNVEGAEKVAATIAAVTETLEKLGAAAAAAATGQAPAVAKDAPFVSMHGEGGGSMLPGDKDNDPGSPAWEHKDAGLADKASRLILLANELVTLLGDRERAEKSGDLAESIRKTTEAMKDLFTDSPIASKEGYEMNLTAEELTSMVGSAAKTAVAELEKAKEDALKKAAKKAAKKAKKADKKKAKEMGPEGEGGEGMAAKTAEAGEAATGAAGAKKMSKSQLVQQLQQQGTLLKEQGELLEKVAAEPGYRPILNAAGIEAGARPVLRSIDGGASDPNSAFKALEDQRDAAIDQAKKSGKIEDSVAVDRLRMELTKAKMIANERARRADPRLNDSPFPDSARIITNHAALPDDPSITGVNGGRRRAAIMR